MDLIKADSVQGVNHAEKPAGCPKEGAKGTGCLPFTDERSSFKSFFFSEDKECNLRWCSLQLYSLQYTHIKGLSFPNSPLSTLAIRVTNCTSTWTRASSTTCPGTLHQMASGLGGLLCLTYFGSDSPENADLGKGPRCLYLLMPYSLPDGGNFRATLNWSLRAHTTMVPKKAVLKTVPKNLWL